MKILLANFTKMINDTGGVAKVLTAFANEMTNRGHQVAVAYSDDRQGDFFYPISDKVKTYNLRHYNGKDVLFPLSMKIKRELLKAVDIRKGRSVNDEFHTKYLLGAVQDILQKFSPDIIVSFHPTASKILICDVKTKIPVITMSHGSPEDYFHTYPVDELPAIEHSTAHQVLVPSFVKPLTNRYPHLRVKVIGNVVPQYEMPVDLSVAKERYKIIFIGRMVKNHKRPHLLIDAFIELAAEFPQWNVELWGGGGKKSYMKAMQAKIDKAGLHDRIRFMGTTHDVESVLRTGDIFVFPSAYEGWGMSLTEAMSMGLPVIGYKSCVAVNELIQDNITGILCGDGDKPLADALRKLMQNKALRAQYGQAARESMKAYDANSIWNQWEDFLRETIC